MKNLLFIDTGAFYARYVKKDQHHHESIKLWKKAQQDKMRYVTSNFVLSETISLFVHRFGATQALQAAREIYSSQIIEIVPLTLELELKGLAWISRFSDQAFTMTDATSFAIMKEHKIKTVFSFDHHFEIAGFERFF